MAFGWSQKFKCGGIESFNNIKAYVDKGALVDEAGGCLTQDPEVANGWALVLHVLYMCATCALHVWCNTGFRPQPLA